MCLGGSKSPPPPPPPPPPAPPAPVPELKTGADDGSKDMGDAQNRKGRRKLRIDMASGTGTGSEGSGLNIPQ
jgi:hypothetical protein